MDPSWLVILAFYAAWRWRPFRHHAALSPVADPDAEHIAVLEVPAEVALVELDMAESRRVVINSSDLDSWVAFRNHLAHEFLQALVPSKVGKSDPALSESVSTAGAVKSTATELDSRSAERTVSLSTQPIAAD